MKKSGFTLIELLVVLILLVVIALIAYPIYTDIITSSKQKLYEQQINDLERYSDNWIINNGEAFKLSLNEVYYLSFEELYEDGFLDSKEVKDPRGGLINGCIVITKTVDGYDTVYDELCEK